MQKIITTLKNRKKMKKVLVLYLIIFGINSVFSQDLIKEIKDLTLENDSLVKQVIKPIRDSISVFQSKLTECTNEKIKLISIIKLHHSKIDSLNQDKSKAKNDSLQKNVDSLEKKIIELKEIISSKDEQIIQEIKLREQKLIEEKEKGKQDAFNQIIQTYNKPFDVLVKSSTLKSVERDLVIIGDNIEVKQKLLNLQKYFTAEYVLSEKYNKQKIETAQSQISDIDKTELVKNLTDKLSEYTLVNNGLKTTINKILVIDKNLDANDDYSQSEKLQKILYELAWYFRNYRFNFIDYPYISEIVLEIINLKQKDANAKIDYIIDKL